ncbi:hypothetical protein D6745_00970 [Candidatus Woesearchaeota archaeon]|nr:MAG: hypothetical protein D6745_00970 [Candidatus Woesearchaeota archaeon]
MHPEIIEMKPINMVQVKSHLKSIKKRDKELDFRGNKLEEYVNKFVKLSDKEAAELYEKISKLNISRLKDEHIHKIIDILPETVDDLKVVLQGYTITLKKDDMTSIVNAVKEFAK